MPLTDFLPPAEIEAKFRKHFGQRTAVALWLCVLGVVAVIAAWFWGLRGPAGPEVFPGGRVAAFAAFSRQHPGAVWEPGGVDLLRPLLVRGKGTLLAPRWWRLSRFNPEARVGALREGITVAVTIGDPLEWSVTLARAVADRRLAGPAIVPAIVLCRAGRLSHWEGGAARSISGPGEARDAVRAALAEGADLVALDAVGADRPGAAELASACATAHGLGRRVLALVDSNAAAADAVHAGVDALVGAPAEDLPEGLLARMVQRHVALAPAVLAASAARRPLVAANAYRAHAAGVALALATAGYPAGGEIAALERTGLPKPLGSELAAAGAAALGLQVAGTATGDRADLVGRDAAGRVKVVVAGGYRVVP